MEDVTTVVEFDYSKQFMKQKCLSVMLLSQVCSFSLFNISFTHLHSDLVSLILEKEEI
jgi:hypothetical protein